MGRHATGSTRMSPAPRAAHRVEHTCASRSGPAGARQARRHLRHCHAPTAVGRRAARGTAGDAQVALVRDGEHAVAQPERAHDLRGRRAMRPMQVSRSHARARDFENRDLEIRKSRSRTLMRSTAIPSAGRDRARTPPRAWAPRATASCARAPVRAPADVQRRRRRRRPRKLRPRPCAAVAPLTVVSTSCPHARREQALRREKDLARQILRRHMKCEKCRCYLSYLFENSTFCAELWE